ncbi:MAG: Na(+)/H(+) antiporter subunit D [Thiolinea sp.]
MSEWFSGLMIPPGLILILGAFILPQVEGRLRSALVLTLPLLTLLLVWLVPHGSNMVFGFMDYELEPLRSSAEGRLFASVFSVAAFAGGLYALNKATLLELSAAFFYAGSAIGVTFAGDLITLFIFWEMMALGSTLVLWANGADNPRAYSTSMRYLLVHLFGGVVLMAGIAGHVYSTGSIAFTSMTPLDGVAKWFILAGFLINAGAPPLSAWIADAYPEASASGMVFLSAFTTKTAVFALLVGFPGTDILIYIGLYMVFYGIIYGLLENDIRRTMAYSIVSQVGFMVTAIGIGSELALNGAAAHAFAHIIYKALLLMSAGSVIIATGKRKFTDLGGLFQSMPVTAIAGIVGALAISAFPFTSGFVTKSLELAAAYQLPADAEDPALLIWAWFLLTVASAGSFLYMGIKFPWFVFFQKDSGLRPADPAPNKQYAMLFFAFMCIALGVFPDVLYHLLPYQNDLLADPKSYKQYTASHLLSQFQLLLFAGIAFFVLLPLIKNTLTISLDFDWFYRRLFKVIGEEFTFKASDIGGKTEAKIRGRVERFINRLHEQHGPQGFLGQSWPSGSMVLWVAILLVCSLGLYYFR